MKNSNTYYEVAAKFENETEILFGSFVREDCKYELEAERDSWKDEGYRSFKITARPTAENPDMSVYTADELATN